jgi:hypothetical protein
MCTQNEHESEERSVKIFSPFPPLFFILTKRGASKTPKKKREWEVNLVVRRKYASVKIPSELCDELEKVEGALGYSSRAWVVNDAIRRFIESKRGVYSV